MLRKFIKKGRTYFQLRISCPACIDKGLNSPITYWLHYLCGGAMFVGDNAHFRCEDCKESDHVQKWEFLCPAHDNIRLEALRLSSGSKYSYAGAISTGGQMVGDTGHKWLIQYLINMNETMTP